MTDPLEVVGSVNLVEIVSTLGHVVREMERLGNVVSEEGRDTRQRFDDLKVEVAACKTELTKQISDLDKAQALTDKEIRVQISKVSAIVSALTGIAIWVLKSGVFAALAAM